MKLKTRLELLEKRVSELHVQLDESQRIETDDGDDGDGWTRLESAIRAILDYLGVKVVWNTFYDKLPPRYICKKIEDKKEKSK